jgi:hypothetical protein
MIRVALFRSRSTVGRLIRWQTRARVQTIEETQKVRDPASKEVQIKKVKYQAGGYSHAAIIVHRPDEKPYIVEAIEGKGVVKALVEDREVGKKEEVDIYACPMSIKQENILIEFLDKQVGKKYDWRMVIRFVPLLIDLTPWWANRRESQKRKSMGKWFCSELVFAAIAKAGIPLFKLTEPWEVSPNMLSKSLGLYYKASVKHNAKDTHDITTEPERSSARAG